METPAPKLRYSPSSINTYFDCAWRFKLAYIDRRTPDFRGNRYSCFGIAVHTAIEEFYKLGDFDRQTSVLDNWPSVFEKEIEEKGVQMSRTDINDFIKEGKKGLLTFYDRQKKDGLLKKPAYAEKKYKIETDEYVSVGIIDAGFDTDEGLEIVDFKTNKRAKSKKAVAEDRQLTMYAWLFWKKTGKLAHRLTLHYIKLDRKVHTTRTLEQLQEFEKFLNDFHIKIRSETEWKANFRFCDWCDFRLGCEKKNGRKIPIIL